MKEASEVFKSIRYAKVAPRDKPHKSTDDEEHGTVGEKEYEDQVKHVKKMTGGMTEEVKDEYDEGEYDREGDMAKSDLRSIIANAQRLHDMMDDADNLPEWVQSKITLAEDYISTVANYLTSEMKEEVKDEYARKVDKYLRKKYNKEEVEYLEEKNAPTNPALWSRAKALARSKFDVYPSAYANGWASKWYKSKGGGWKSVSEEVEQIEEGPDKFVAKVINKVTAAKREPLSQKSDRREFETPGKPGKVNESRAKDIAKMAARRNAGMKEEMEPEDSLEKTNTPAKRSLSKTAGMVKDLAKNAKATKKEKSDTFQSEPELSSQIVKV